MKQRERKYKPRDTRTARHQKERQIDIGDGGMVDEFEALLSMRDQFTPEVNEAQERAGDEDRDAPVQNDAKGIER